MLSIERSDIGAGVATDGEQIFVVIETALQTSSGKFQYNAYPTMTALVGVPQHTVTSSGEDGISQYMQPVQMNTALPKGEVYHVVQHGQTLWGIAINYHTTIRQILQLNNLTDTTIMQGQKLLVARGATQPATISPPISTPANISSFVKTVTQHPSTSAITGTEAISFSQQKGAAMGIWAIVIAALVLAGFFTVFFRKSE